MFKKSLLAVALFGGAFAGAVPVVPLNDASIVNSYKKPGVVFSYIKCDVLPEDGVVKTLALGQEDVLWFEETFTKKRSTSVFKGVKIPVIRNFLEIVKTGESTVVLLKFPNSKKSCVVQVTFGATEKSDVDVKNAKKDKNTKKQPTFTDVRVYGLDSQISEDVQAFLEACLVVAKTRSVAGQVIKWSAVIVVLLALVDLFCFDGLPDFKDLPFFPWMSESSEK